MALAQKPDFVFRRKERFHLNRRGRQFSRLLAAEVCASVIVMLDRTMFRGSVKSTGYPLHSPVSASLPLQCVTVCHHISTGIYLLKKNCTQSGTLLPVCQNAWPQKSWCLFTKRNGVTPPHNIHIFRKVFLHKTFRYQRHSEWNGPVVSQFDMSRTAWNALSFCLHLYTGINICRKVSLAEDMHVLVKYRELFCSSAHFFVWEKWKGWVSVTPEAQPPLLFPKQILYAFFVTPITLRTCSLDKYWWPTM